MDATDVTSTIVSDLRSGYLPVHLRGLSPAPKITPAGRTMLQQIDGLLLGYTSNPLAYDEAVRGFTKQQHKTLLRLLLGGFVQVFRVSGPLPGVHKQSRVGAHGQAHYMLRAKIAV